MTPTGASGVSRPWRRTDRPMADEQTAAADGTAVRVALWRTMHVQVDGAPHVLEDEIGLQLVAPDAGWRRRPDMDPGGTSPFRAGIVARARFVEDLVAEQAARGVTQYVILGAGLDTFAQRRPEIASRLTVFEVDQPGPQAWTRNALSNWASVSPSGCGWCRSTSRQVGPGGIRWSPPASIPASRRSSSLRASPCTSPKTPTGPPCARSPGSPPPRHSP